MKLECKKNLEILEKIYEDNLSSIYRGIYENEKVTLKCLKENSRKPLLRNQLENEYEILKKINSSHVIKALGLEKLQNKLFLVLENWNNGQTLDNFIKKKDLDIKKILKIAIEIAQAVGEVHQCDVVHKDINPQNILINEDFSKIKLFDFGIASLLSREMQQIVSPNLLHGTLAYLSPEQSGFMNRAIDYRSDIYSLGITLYKMFTKKLPFEGSTPKDIIYQHIAALPTPPSHINTRIPETLSDIILKCMAKNIEDRYQSAFGLKNDLEACLISLTNLGYVEPFIPGNNDVFDHFQIAQKIYGREAEIEELQNSFQAVSRGAFHIVMIRGQSGIGKTSVVHELYKSIIKKNGYFISGKFELNKNNKQYFALIQALQELIQQVLAETKETLAERKQQILEALGDNGQLMLELVPDLQLIIGSQAPLPILDPKETEIRFQTTLNKFIEVFTTREHPLILFLDDLQWIDEASLKFLHFFISNLRRNCCLFIGSYRDNEVGLSHPLNTLFEELKNSNIKAKEFEIKPLNLGALSKLICDSFRISDSEAKTLSQHIFSKTGGNPFFFIEFLKALYVKGIVSFNTSSQKWIFDAAKIDQMPVADNIADLMAEKLRTLGKETQSLLQIGAAIGGRFTLQCLTKVRNATPDKILIDLEAAKQNELILMKQMSQEEIEFVFHHDRIQQAAYGLIPIEEREKLHYKIGQALLEIAGNKVSEQIIDIVSQLNYGISFLNDPEEKAKLAALNLDAGRKAGLVGAYAAGRSYLEIGMQLLQTDGWDTQYDLCFAIHENLVLCMSVTGAKDKAEDLLRHLFHHAKTKNEKGRIYLLKISFLSTMAQYNQIIETGIEALRLFGIKSTLNPTKFALITLGAKVFSQIALRGLSNITQMPKNKNEEVSILMQLFSELGTAALLVNNKKLLLFMFLQGVNFTLKQGPSEQSGFIFGMIALELLDEKTKMHLIPIAMKFIKAGDALAALYPNTRGAANRMVSSCSYFLRFNKHAKECIGLVRKAYENASKTASLYLAAAAQRYLILTMLQAGEPVENIMIEIKEMIYTAAAQKNSIIILRLLPFYDFFLRLGGRKADEWIDKWGEKYKQECTKASADKNKTTLLYHERILQLTFLFLTDASLPILTKAYQELWEFEFFLTEVWWDFACFYGSLVQAKIYDSDPSPKNWRMFASSIKKFKILAKYSPYFNHQYLLISAEKARLQQNIPLAIENYEKAIESAEAGGYVQDQALTCKLTANCYLQAGKKKLAAFYMQAAYDLYMQWGASEAAKMIQTHYPELLVSVETSATPTLTKTINKNDTAAMIQSFDIETLSEALQTLSKEIVFEKLIQSLMHNLIIYAGATTAFFITLDNNQLIVRAQMENSLESLSLPNVLIDKKKDGLSLAIVSLVEQSRKPFLLGNTDNQNGKGTFLKDTYLQDKNPKSLLCLPLMHQEKFHGILYLENTITSGVFTPARVKILDMLSAQMAISLENAQFYATLEEKVRSRTQELQDALQQLKDLQKMMIQQEKLASLGVLTSGIAHEIRNPLNFIINFSNISKELNSDMHEKICFLLQKFELDKLEELRSDNVYLQDLLSKIDTYGLRIDKIIKNMIDHSGQANTEVKYLLEDVDINQALSQALRISQEAFSAKSFDMAVTITAKYDPLIKKIHGKSKDLQKAFCNIFDNALYALNTKKALNADFIPQLAISTAYDQEKIEIIIEDNGTGIASQNLEKIFQPFFTTKPTGEGSTGLGLSIAYDIVVKEHDGTIQALSEENQYTKLLIHFKAN